MCHGDDNRVFRAKLIHLPLLAIDYDKDVAAMETANSILFFYFAFATMVAMFICFFSLVRLLVRGHLNIAPCSAYFIATNGNGC